MLINTVNSTSQIESAREYLYKPFKIPLFIEFSCKSISVKPNFSLLLVQAIEKAEIVVLDFGVRLYHIMTISRSPSTAQMFNRGHNIFQKLLPPSCTTGKNSDVF